MFCAQSFSGKTNGLPTFGGPNSRAKLKLNKGEWYMEPIPWTPRKITGRKFTMPNPVAETRKPNS